jgi:hypothetical protein
MSNKIDIGIKIDLEKLISSRLLIQASSGGGKSYAIRKAAEQLINHVQVIIIDIEGEFVSLREMFPFALVSKEGEIPLNIRYAETLAHKLLETNLSAIIDMSEMEVHQRRIFAKRFLHALIESPKQLWHPCVVIIDESDFFAPEGKESESTRAVINLSSRGRKRGICAILATQRIAKLSKDATADILNKIVGLTGQDIDQKRAGNELGFATRNDVISLRNLKPGEFYGFGPAISNEVIKFKVSKTETTHTESGQYRKITPATPNAIKKILGKLADIPEEAEKELNSKQQFQDEIKRLTSELKKKPIAAGKPIAVPDEKMKQENVWLKKQLQIEKNSYNTLVKIVQNRNTQLNKAVKTLSEIPGVDIPIKEDIKTLSQPVAGTNPAIKSFVQPKQIASSNGTVTGGAMRMLKAAAMFSPEKITKTRMAALARLSHTSGSFSTYMSTLKREGLLVGEGNLFTITEEGLKHAGEVDPLPTDPEELINLWCGVIGENGGAARMLRALSSNYPNEITKTDLGETVNMSSTSGSFSTYLSTLKRNGLIKTQGQNVKASDELFN